jgi:coenzyme PQQ biosynthesis protein PqqD
MLLYPERGLLLNPTAADIVQLCTGEHTVEEIVDSLAAKYPAQSREAVEREALTFLVEIHARGLLEVATEAPGEGSTPSVADRGGRKPWEG